MSAVPAKVLNDLFFDKIGSAEGKDKIAEFGGTYIRDRLREVSFARKVVPPTPVQRTELQRSVNHDTLVKIVDIEPNSAAMSMGFRGQPTARLIRAPRFEIPFFTISSEKFEKTEQELLAYEMPITKIIEENSVKDIQAIEDRQFLIYVEAAVQAMQASANSNTIKKLNKTTYASVVKSSVVKGSSAVGSQGSNDFVVWPVLKGDFISLKQLLHRRFLRAERILITEPDYDNLSAWTITDAWNIAAETATEGWKSNTVVGLKIIRTIKTNILREGNVYCFTAPEFFGRFYVLNQTKFYIDKIANLITWQSWEDIGMGIGNIGAVVKLELFGGSVAPGANAEAPDSGYAAGLPLDEDNLSPVNNKVDDAANPIGGHSPMVEQF
jgi:hypothetical protein